MNIRVATAHDTAAWDDLVTSSHYGSFLQTWAWGDVQVQAGIPIHRYCVEEGGALVGVGHVLIRNLPFGRSWMYIPRGPVVKDEQMMSSVMKVFQQELQKLAAETNAIFVRVDPPIQSATSLQELGWKKAEREVQPRHTLVLDVTQSEEELLAKMHSKTRYNVRLAQKKGVTVRFSSDPKDVDVFLELSKEVTGRSGFRFHPDEYYRSIMNVLSHASSGASVELAIAEYEGKPLAAHMMIYAGRRATYAHGASSLENRSLMAPLLVYWETIKRAKEKGCTSYDFFGAAPPEADASHSWSGITRVKKGFGGVYESYVGAYDYVFEPAQYLVFNTARRIRRLLPS